MTDPFNQPSLPIFDQKPRTLELLLKALGWNITGGAAKRYVSWSHSEQHHGELLEPIDEDAPDYDYMAGQLLAMLTTAHGESRVSRARAAVSMGASDLKATRWHKETDSAPGLIRWPVGEELFHSVRDQLAAAAKARQSHRPYFGASNTFVARDFLGKCFLGQSDVGSYILTAHTPRTALAYVSQSFAEGATKQNAKREPVAFSGEEIMRTFDSALSAVRQSLDEKSDRDRVESIKAAVPLGVSYEFTAALSRFVAGGDCAVELEYVKQGNGRVGVREISFEAPEAEVLTKAAEAFLRAQGPVRSTVTGIVTDLKHEPGNAERIVRLFAGARSPVQRLRLRLSPEHYSSAIAAHDNDLLVRVTGTIVREGRRAWMHEPDHFSVVGASEAVQDLLFE